MKIVVVGGCGLIGSKLVAALTRDGHEVEAASRRSGFDTVSGSSAGPSNTAPVHTSNWATYGVTVDGEIGRIEVPLARAIQSA